MSPPAWWKHEHGRTLATALKEVLGEPARGAMAFVRCLTPDVVRWLADDRENFGLRDWNIHRVADAAAEPRTITADQAVEIREAKQHATLLLVDTSGAGAGMDGIYNAARELREDELFRAAHRMAAGRITELLNSQHRKYAETAVRRARGFGGRFSVSPWTVYDFYCRIAANQRHAGAYLHLLGLWPVAAKVGREVLDDLDVSARFVDRLLGSSASGLMPAERIDALRLVDATPEQRSKLESFLVRGRTLTQQAALERLAHEKHLWINELRVEDSSEDIRAIELQPWRSTAGRVLKWSGLMEIDPGEPPRLVINPDLEVDESKLEVRWKTRPAALPKGAVRYRARVVTTVGDEELAYRDEVLHRGTATEKCTFVGEEFTVSEGVIVRARVVVDVPGVDGVKPQETEEFEIRLGEQLLSDAVAGGKAHRTFVEGLIELGSEEVACLTGLDDVVPKNAKGFLSWRSPRKRMAFRVQRPPLIKDVEEYWRLSGNVVGRWKVKVRASGERVGGPEFLPTPKPDSVSSQGWARLETACKKMIVRFGDFGGVGQVYDASATGFENVEEYLRAWTAILDEATDQTLALANTVEVRSQSDQLLGLIVLPSHPLRVAWHVAYDNLVLHAAFVEEQSPADVRKEFGVLDGAMFPAMLPGLAPDHTFVFADMLGFHAVGMVRDSDREPKATVAILRRVMGDKENSKERAVPRIGTTSAEVLAAEVVKYLECHDACHTLHVHALRAGDGRTVARALGEARRATDKRQEENEKELGTPLSFVLELYPSSSALKAGVVGRFIAECQEKRRRRAGEIREEDRWLLGSVSLPGGLTKPQLRWARKEDTDPDRHAHLAVAFDTFESQVEPDDSPVATRPYHAFGLLSFLDRQYQGDPVPNWRGTLPAWSDGDKHPGNRTHTDRLMRLQNHVQLLVARVLHVESEGDGWFVPVLRTRISRDKADSLERLHELSDWVVTLDRNAGIEYFDSPHDNHETYDKYVIDSVPEREDLGCLQLITSTTNLEEVQGLLNKALDRMGVSRSPRNAKFLLEQLKALSGRLAIRLTGINVPASELIGLAMVQANCAGARASDPCWTSLRDGFFVPVDDVRDLLPPLQPKTGEGRGSPRPDLIYVTNEPRKGLVFRFIEVKYRRHLRTARSLDVAGAIRRQTAALRKGWYHWYSHETVSSFRAVRRAKLARVLRFYADKGHRHDLSSDRHRALVAEIDRMVARGGDYMFADEPGTDLGWIFCPEYQEPEPQCLSPPDDDVGIYLFGPAGLPDLNGRWQPRGASSDTLARIPAEPASTIVPAPPPQPEIVEPESKASGPNPELAEPDPELEPPKPVPEPAEPEQEPAGMSAASHPLESTVVLGTDRLANARRVTWKLTVKGNPHLLVAGLPGMGKTTCLLNLCRQMLDHDVRPIVFSYHQDLDEKLSAMIDPIRFIDFDGLGFNPLRVHDRGTHRPHLEVAGVLRDIFMAIYPSLGELQGEAIRSAVKECFAEVGWGKPGADQSELPDPPFRRFFEILAGHEDPDRGHRNLQVRLEELNDYGFFDVGKTHGSLWDSPEPTVIRIHRTQSDVLQRAFSSLVLYGLYKDMFRRGIQNRITHAVIFDEAHRAGKLGVVPTMAKECRKYGVSLVLASQEAHDFHKSVFSAVANYLVLRLTDADAKALVRNVADSRQEKALIDKIKQMRRFRALYFQEGKTRPNHVDLLNYTEPV